MNLEGWNRIPCSAVVYRDTGGNNGFIAFQNLGSFAFPENQEYYLKSISANWEVETSTQKLLLLTNCIIQVQILDKDLNSIPSPRLVTNSIGFGEIETSETTDFSFTPFAPYQRVDRSNIGGIYVNFFQYQKSSGSGTDRDFKVTLNCEIYQKPNRNEEE